MTDENTPNNQSTSTPRPPYRLGFTIAAWATYGVICTSVLIDHHPKYFHPWPGWLEIVLYVAIAISTAATFTIIRYLFYGIPNHGRWMIIWEAGALAAGFYLWPNWGMPLTLAAAVIGIALDRFARLPEPRPKS